MRSTGQLARRLRYIAIEAARPRKRSSFSTSRERYSNPGEGWLAQWWGSHWRATHAASGRGAGRI